MVKKSLKRVNERIAETRKSLRPKQLLSWLDVDTVRVQSPEMVEYLGVPGRNLVIIMFTYNTAKLCTLHIWKLLLVLASLFKRTAA